MKQEGIDALARLPGIGEVTKKHLAKNVGLIDTAKDDVWLTRLARMFRAASVDALVSYLAEEFGESQHTIDLVMWRYCAESGWEAHGFDSLADYVDSL